MDEKITILVHGDYIVNPSPPPPPTPFYRHRYFWWGVATGFMVCFGITATTSDPALLQWGFDRILTGVGFGN